MKLWKREPREPWFRATVEKKWVPAWEDDLPGPNISQPVIVLTLREKGKNGDRLILTEHDLKVLREVMRQVEREIGKEERERMLRTRPEAFDQTLLTDAERAILGKREPNDEH